MALFGKNKKNKTAPEAELEEKEAVQEAESGESAAAEVSPEDRFKAACGEISKCVRVVFPQQMVIGFYYGELQSGGYIDDFCCYATDGKLLERGDIPRLCGISLPDMVSREEKIEAAFMELHNAAPEATKKDCNAVSLTILGNGQVKIDITSGGLTEGEEEIRYNSWRKRVEKGNPRYMAPKISDEKMKVIQAQTSELYKQLGTEFYSFLPGDDFKIAYFYTEINDGSVFFYHRLITNDGEFVDGDELFDKFGMDKEEAIANRTAVVKLIMDIRSKFISSGEKPFTTVTLSVTGKGEFQSKLSFGPTDPEGEQKRLEQWKKDNVGEPAVNLNNVKK